MLYDNHPPKNDDNFSRKIYTIVIIVAIVFFIFLLRLIFLQLVKGTKYFDYSQNNRLYTKRILAPRGSIFDRKGKPLVYSLIKFVVTIKPAYTRSSYIKQALSFLNRNLDKEYDFSRRELMRRNYVVDNNLSMDEAIKILERSDLPEYLDVDFKFQRKYAEGENASQFIGYIGKISAQRLDHFLSKNYDIDENVGIDGVELFYEDYLHGNPGMETFVVDARRNFKGNYDSIPSQSGHSITLTIDEDIQKFCYQVMNSEYEENGFRGVALVMNPKDASILAMVSTPSYDPNIFTAEKSLDELEKVKKDKPFLNRAISAIYPPGSIFKILIAYIALENKLISADTQFYCSGKYYLKNWNKPFTCWIWTQYGTGHGYQNIIQALKNSCNVFFYELSNYVSSSDYLEGMELFGLGDRIGIDLPGEAKGFIPSRKLKAMSRRGGVDGEILNLFIGQGQLTVTPIQIANIFCAIANGGNLYKPYIVKHIEDIDGNIILETEPTLIRKIPLSYETRRILLDGLFKVVNERGGTAYKSKFDKSYKIAGKTGTAQNPHKDPHSWFVGFAPVEDPDVLILVLFENAGHGGDVAAPVAKKIFDFYYNPVTDDESPEEEKEQAEQQP